MTRVKTRPTALTEETWRDFINSLPDIPDDAISKVNQIGPYRRMYGIWVNCGAPAEEVE